MRKAFTLVELFVVVVIAVILIAVALPTAKYSIEEGRLREGARQINAYFAAAKAHAQSTGCPAGVWMELETIGDPNANPSLQQCSQLFLAEVPPPYGGDVQGARLVVRNSPGDNAPLNPNPPQIPMSQPVSPPLAGWILDFQNAANVGQLGTLVKPGESFRIRIGSAQHIYAGIRSDSNGEYYVIDLGIVPPHQRSSTSSFTNQPSVTIPIDYSFQIYRQPVRIGKPLELPQGIVIDPSYSGLGTTGLNFANCHGRLLTMFSPSGSVASVSYIPQAWQVQEDTGTSHLYFLIGRTEHVEHQWQNVAASNIADGGNLWVTVNRRTGSVGTVENTPSPTMPFGTAPERAAFIQAAREFATAGDVKGGQ